MARDHDQHEDSSQREHGDDRVPSHLQPSGQGAGTDVVPDKMYFKIGEVARLVGVETHVLRYWERMIPAVRPSKTSSNQRRYRRQDVVLFVEVRRLLRDEGYTLSGAKQRLAAAQQAQRQRLAAARSPAVQAVANLAAPAANTVPRTGVFAVPSVPATAAPAQGPSSAPSRPTNPARHARMAAPAPNPESSSFDRQRRRQALERLERLRGEIEALRRLAAAQPV